MTAPKASLTRRRWFRFVLAAAIAGNLIGAGGAMYMLGDAHDLTVDEAVRKFRAINAAASSAPSASPTATPSALASATAASRAKKRADKPGAAGGSSTTSTAGKTFEDLETGVYVYDTEGYEETDALSGQRHDYPEQTTITASDHACGVRFTWQPLKERWDRSDTCIRNGDVELVRFAIYHEFFHKGITEDFALEAGSVVLPREAKAGDTWRWKGASDDSKIDTLTKVIGFETIQVGGVAVHTMHIRYETAMSGANEGTQIQDRWHATDTGILVRLVNDVDARVVVPFGGTAHYVEHYRIDLISTKPQG